MSFDLRINSGEFVGFGRKRSRADERCARSGFEKMNGAALDAAINFARRQIEKKSGAFRLDKNGIRIAGGAGGFDFLRGRLTKNDALAGFNVYFGYFPFHFSGVANSIRRFRQTPLELPLNKPAVELATRLL